RAAVPGRARGADRAARDRVAAGCAQPVYVTDAPHPHDPHPGTRAGGWRRTGRPHRRARRRGQAGRAADDRWQPDGGTAAGVGALTHELAHTLQQEARPVAGHAHGPDLAVSEPGDRDELAATAAGTAAARGITAPRSVDGPVAGFGGAAAGPRGGAGAALRGG